MIENEKEHFIPNNTAPNNWAFFGERSNPLSSKGAIESTGDYYDYETQYYDFLEAEKEDDSFYD